MPLSPTKKLYGTQLQSSRLNRNLKGMEPLETRTLLSGQTVWVIDDFDAGYYSTAGLTPQGWPGAASYGEDYATFFGVADDALKGEIAASWTFENITPGIYQLSASWIQHTNRSESIEYLIRAGDEVLQTTYLNHKNAPLADAISNDGIKDVNFQHLGGPVVITGDSVTVEVANRNDTRGGSADAVRLEQISEFSSAYIADDNEAATQFTSFSTTSGWSDPNGNAVHTYNDRRLLADGGDGSKVATWGFDNLVPGVYQVATTWQYHPTVRNTAAPYSIYSDGDHVHTELVNQRNQPQPDLILGPDNTRFQIIADQIAISDGELAVELSNLGSGFVAADAVHIVRVGDLPNVHISDDLEAATQYTSFSTAGSWYDPNGNAAQTYNGRRLLATGSDGSQVATWQFDNLAEGAYRVSTTWQAHPTNRNTAAPYSIYSDGELLYVEHVNQRLQTQGDVLVGPSNTPFQTLADQVLITGSNLQVTLSDLGGGTVVADAVHIEKIASLSEVPAKPTGVRIVGGTGGDVGAGENVFHARARQRIIWDSHPANVTGFEIWRSHSGYGNPDTHDDWELVTTTQNLDNLTPTNIRQFATDVSSTRPFHYRIRAYGIHGFSDWSDSDRIDFQTHEEVITQVSAAVDNNPVSPSITLKFVDTIEVADDSYTIERRNVGDASWLVVADNSQGLTTGITSWTDTNVALGEQYEYRVKRSLKNPNRSASYGYVLAGLEAPLVEDRGTLLLVIDNTHSAALDVEIRRLERDLIGDGWRVARAAVSPTDSPTDVKAQIVAANEFYDDLKSVFLLGQVAVPRSGWSSPDGHFSRSLAADMFYGDMDGTWTDTIDFGSAPFTNLYDNFTGDGRFDQQSFQAPLQDDHLPELAVGRVDLSDMSSFGSEVDLLRRYLNKDHDYRNGHFTVRQKGLIDDHWFTFFSQHTNNVSGESHADWAWRDFSAMFGVDNVDQDNSSYVETLSTDSYLWVNATSNGAGNGGNPYGLNAVANTDDYVNNTMLGVFHTIVSSYSLEYERPNAFLNAPLAGEGYGLTSFWTRFGDPHFHRMGLGQTIGESLQLSRNGEDPFFGKGLDEAYTNLLGDPSLRLNVVAPASALVSNNASSGGVELTWTASPDANVAGYHVYRFDEVSGRFQRVNLGTNPVSAPSFTDALGDVSTDHYMVRAVKIEETGSGTYWNASQGIFSDPSAVQGENIGGFDQVVVVNSTADEASPLAGVQTLRSAALSANSNPGETLIIVPEGLYNLSVLGNDNSGLVGDIDIAGDLTMIGAGPGKTIINATGLNDRVIEVLGGGNLNLRGFTITGGEAINASGGGILANVNSALTLNYTVLQGNRATISGAGLFDGSGATVLDSVIANNTVTGSTSGGGGIYTSAGVSTVVANTIIANNSSISGDSDWQLNTGGSATSLGHNLLSSAGSSLVGLLQPSDIVDPNVDYIVTVPFDNNRTTPTLDSLALREAVILANASQGDETIWLPAWSINVSLRGTASLGELDPTLGDIDVLDSVSIRGIESFTEIVGEQALGEPVFHLAGDIDNTGVVDLTDFGIWKNSHDHLLSLNLPGDANQSGVIDSGDLQLYFDTFGDTGPGLAADFNGDNVVDTADGDILIASLNVISALDLEGDANGDGYITIEDFDIISDHFFNELGLIDISMS